MRSVKQYVILDINEDVEWFFPLHKNPRKRRFTDPDRTVGSPSCHFHFGICTIFESSYMYDRLGWLQEEVPSMGQFGIEECNRQTQVEAGLKLAETKSCIVALASELLSCEEKYKKWQEQNPYGDGKSSRIVKAILAKLHK